MSKYTTQLRFICEEAAGYDESKGYKSINEIIQKAIPKIFDFDFPIFDPEYKNVLCTKILKHYYTREICCETVGRWKLFLDSELNEIMPYYNQLYASEKLKFDPLHDVDMTTTQEKKGSGTIGVTGSTSGEYNKSGTDSTEHTGSKHGTDEDTENKTSDTTTHDESTNTRTDKAKTTTDGTTSGTATNSSEVTGNEMNLYADTPQGGITGLLAGGVATSDAKYLTNARKIDRSETKEDNGTTSGTNNSTTDFDDTITDNGSADGTKKVKDVGTRNGQYDETSSGTDDRNWSEKGNDSGTSKSDTISSSTEEYVLHVAGKTAGGSYSKMLNEFRDTFLNIDLQVINSLNDLFFGLW